jgi:mono/diheme cytochrome c family protein
LDRSIPLLAQLALLCLATPLGAAASSIEKQPPAKIYAAICSTCHGAAGQGGNSWIDGDVAPWIASASKKLVKDYIRMGYGRSMPAFGKTAITDDELEELTQFINSHMVGIPAPEPPAGRPVRVDILDADPWYRDDGSDSIPDRRRVGLAADQYLTVVNTGRTWHTLTNEDLNKDSGLISCYEILARGEPDRPLFRLPRGRTRSLLDAV